MNKTSIVILTYNQLDYTKMCIESIRLFTKPAYEIIVVDNASTDGTPDWLKNQADITTIFNDENKGFAGGCNQGILKSSGDVVLLLNNDTIVTPRWLDNILACLKSSDEIGAVVPLSNTDYDFLQDADLSADYDSYNYAKIVAFAEKFNVSNPDLWEDRVKLGAFCLAVKKEVIQKIGLLDEQFFPAYCEDDDYSFRLRMSGYKMIRCNDTFVHHFHNMSTKDEPLPKLIGMIKENQQRTLRKWGFYSLHCTIRADMVELMNKSDSLRSIRVLDIGCGCGGTLLKIKYRFKKAELYGIDINQNAASLAAKVANIKIGDAGKMDFDYPPNFFDYVFLPNILELMVNPWDLLAKIKPHLRPTGQIIASIYNRSHFLTIFSLLNGWWKYSESQESMFNKNHLRYFTLKSFDNLLQQNNCSINQVVKVAQHPTQETESFWKFLQKSVPPEKCEDLLAAMYLVKAGLRY